MNNAKHLTDRRSLLATVSAVALTFAWGSEANAADVYVPGATPIVDAGGFKQDAADIWVAAEGRYNRFTSSGIFNDAVNQLYYGYNSDANGDPKDGWSGGLELGARPAGSQWDYVGRLIYGRADGDGSTYDLYTEGSTLYSSADISVEEEHIIADFEVGRHMNIGLGDTRIHAGVRLAHFDARASGEQVNYGVYSEYNEFVGNQTITAFGPRVGIDQKIPVANNLSVDLSVAGAVLFGRRETSFGHSGYSDYGGGYNFGHVESDSESVTVWNAEASAALTYLFGNASLSAGYRVDAFWDLYDAEGTGDFSGSDGDRITHGPFAKLKVYLSGGDH